MIENSEDSFFNYFPGMIVDVIYCGTKKLVTK